MTLSVSTMKRELTCKKDLSFHMDTQVAPAQQAARAFRAILVCSKVAGPHTLMCCCMLNTPIYADRLAVTYYGPKYLGQVSNICSTCWAKDLICCPAICAGDTGIQGPQGNTGAHLWWPPMAHPCHVSHTGYLDTIPLTSMMYMPPWSHAGYTQPLDLHCGCALVWTGLG